ncbi:MAG: sodium:solute symporter family transporter, partial [Opitutaceae bacterium]
FAVGLGVFFIGSILYTFYTQAPDKGAFSIPSSEVFPKFIIEELPAGVKGLLVASVLSAAMSTISAVLNSVTTVTIADFYNRFARQEASVKLARIVTATLGAISVLLSGVAGALGNILVVAMKLSSFFGGPLVGLFLLGMLTRRVGANGAFTGLWMGIATAVAMGTLTEISFLWYPAFSAAVTYLTGWLLGFALTGDRPRAVSADAGAADRTS